jgi:hypothetical protein
MVQLVGEQIKDNIKMDHVDIMLTHEPTCVSLMVINYIV